MIGRHWSGILFRPPTNQGTGRQKKYIMTNEILKYTFTNNIYNEIS